MTDDLILDDASIAFLTAFPLDAGSEVAGTTRPSADVTAPLTAARSAGLANELRAASWFFGQPASAAALDRHLCIGDAEFSPDAFEVRLPRRPDRPDPEIRARLLLSIDRRMRVGHVLVNLHATRLAVDDLVYLSQSFYGAASAAEHAARSDRPITVAWNSERLASLDAVVDACIASAWPSPLAGPPVRSKFRCIEIKALGGFADPIELLHAHPKPMYGLLTADEGWRHVPRDVAVARVSDLWQTRDFVAVVCFHRTMLSVNFKPSDYVSVEQERWVEYFGVERPYFSLNSEIAGLEHGALAVLERLAARDLLARRLDAAVRARRATGPGTLSPWARSRAWLIRVLSFFRTELTSLRRELIQGLNQLRPTHILEIGLLEQKAERAMVFSAVIDRLNDQLHQIDQDVRVAYENAINTLIIILTIAGVLIAVLQLMGA